MPRITNGGIIGKLVTTPTKSTAVGKWNAYDQYLYRQRDIWTVDDIIKSGLYVHYDAGNTSSYPGSGTTLYDLSGNGRNSTLVNGVSYTSLKNGGLVFDGTNDYIQTSNLTFTPMSISCWLYNNSTIKANDGSIGGPSTYQSLFSFGNYYGVNFDGWTGSGTNEAVHIWDTTYRLTYTNEQVPIGYHNFAFNWNGSNYDIWIDGVKKNSIAGTSGHAQLINYSATPINIGASVNNGYYFYGNIFVFAMYSSSLTDQQMSQNFNALRNRFGI